MEPEEIASRGGVDELFASLDVEGILLNEMRYEDLKRLKSELQRRKEEEERAAEEARKKEELSGESTEASEEQTARGKA